MREASLVANRGNKALELPVQVVEDGYMIEKFADGSKQIILVVAGQELASHNKSISRYFTTKESLPFFKEHDLLIVKDNSINCFVIMNDYSYEVVKT